MIKFKDILCEVSEQEVSKIQSFIDSNQFLKGKIVTEKDLIDGDKFVLYVSDDALSHIKERHKDETKPGSTFDSSVNLRDVLSKLINLPPSEQSGGRVKWLGVNVGSPVGKMGIKVGSAEEVAKMEDYQMPDGKKEMVKVTIGERNPTSEISLITSELGQLENGKKALSLITAFPGGMSVDGVELPMDRGEFANKGLYFVINNKSSETMNNTLNETFNKHLGYLKKKLITENITDDWFSEGAFSTYKKPAVEQYEIAAQDGVLKTLEGEQAYKKGYYILTGPKGEKYSMPPEKFNELKDDLGDDKCSPKKIMKVAKLADHDGSVQTSWGAKLDYTAGNDYIVKHGPGDYGVVKKDIFDTTYVKS